MSGWFESRRILTGGALALLLFGAAVGCGGEEDDYVDLALTVDGDQDGYADGDCDDAQAQVHPGATERSNGQDDDCDARVDEDTAAYDDDGDGFSEDQGDQDDANPQSFPGAPEAADGADNDQDGAVDEDTARADDDGDGFSENQGDQDDADPATYPGAFEISDGADNDQDGRIDEGVPAPTPTPAADGDDDGVSPAAGDCDDGDPSIHPGATEAEDGDDQDCDGRVDEGTAAYDGDGDGYTSADGDCDDRRASVYPGASETVGGKPDGLDNDCDGDVDEGTAVYDGDGDGFTPGSGDCDDADATAFPGAAEAADGADDDCDGAVDEGTSAGDDDGDGHAEADGDCDDADGTAFPGAAEACDGADDDCDGLADEPCLPCQVPDDVGDLDDALALGCAVVELSSAGDRPALTLIDPPASVEIRPQEGHGDLASLTVVLTPSDAPREVWIHGFDVEGASQVDNGDPEATVTLSELSFDGVKGPRGALALSGPGISVADTVFEDCQAQTDVDAAGAIVAEATPSLRLSRVTFSRNSVYRSQGRSAGALWLGAGSDLTVESCLFEGNEAHAETAAGAIYVADGVDGGVRILNATFVGNLNGEHEDAAALRCGGDAAAVSFDSAILWNQEGEHVTGCADVSFQYCDVQGGAPAGTGNVSVDPRFRGDSSYRLQPTSPVIDAGNPDALRNDQDGSRNDQGYTGGPNAP